MIPKFSSAASIDLFSIYATISLEAGERIADRFAASISDLCNMVAAQPGMGHIRDDFSMPTCQVRCLAHGRYLVLYTLVDGQVLILRVLHGARDVRPEAVVEDELPDTDA